MMTYDKRQTLYYLCNSIWDILYIGKSISTLGRMGNHSVDKNKEPWWQDVCFVHIEHIPDQIDLDEAEKHRIRTMSPKYNKQRYDGTLASADNVLEGRPGNLETLVTYESHASLENAKTLVKSMLPHFDYSLEESLYDLLILQREQAFRELAKQRKEQMHRESKSHEALEMWLMEVGRINWVILELLDAFETVEQDKIPRYLHQAISDIKHIFANMRSRPSHWEILELPSTRGSKILRDAMRSSHDRILESEPNEDLVGSMRRRIDLWNSHT
jgi:hypothetical protein